MIWRRDIVAGQYRYVAMLGSTGHASMLENIAAAVDARAFTVP